MATLPIPPALQKFMDIAGPLGKLFSFANSIYSSYETKLYRAEVLKKLDDLISGQALLDIEISKLAAAEHIKDYEDAMNMTLIGNIRLAYVDLLTSLKTSKTKADRDEAYQTFYEKAIADCGGKDNVFNFPNQLSNFLDTFYDVVTDPGAVTSLQPGDKPLFDYVYTIFNGTANEPKASPIKGSSVSQGMYNYYLKVMAYVSQVLTMLALAKDTPGLAKPKEKKSAEDLYKTQMKAWFSTYDDGITGSKDPKLSRLITAVQNKFNSFGEKDVWRGPLLKTDKHLSPNSGIDRFCVDWITASENEVVIGWDLTVVDVPGGQGFAPTLTTAKLLPNGTIDASSIKNVGYTRGNSVAHISNGVFSESWIAYNEDSSHKAWNLSEMRLPDRRIVSFKNSIAPAQNEAVITWVVAGIALGVGFYLFTDEDTLFYYIVPRVRCKPVVLFNGKYYVGSMTNEVYSNPEKYALYSPPRLGVNCKKPAINFQTIATGAPLQAPLTGIRFGTAITSESDPVICAQSKLDFHNFDVAGIYPYSKTVNLPTDMSKYLNPQGDFKQRYHTVTDFVNEVVEHSPITVPHLPWSKVAFYKEKDDTSNPYYFTDLVPELGRYGLDDEVEAAKVYVGNWDVYKDSLFQTSGGDIFPAGYDLINEIEYDDWSSIKPR